MIHIVSTPEWYLRSIALIQLDQISLPYLAAQFKLFSAFNL
jgi:hypothetical protein